MFAVFSCPFVLFPISVTYISTCHLYFTYIASDLAESGWQPGIHFSTSFVS